MKLIVFVMILLLSGCSTSPEQQLYQQRLTAEKPRTVWLEIEADAQIPVELVSAAYSLLPAQLEEELSLTVLNAETEQKLAADAVMKVRITDWHRNSTVLHQSGSLAADYQLVSGKSGQLLWQQQEQIANWNFIVGRTLAEEAVSAVLTDLQNESARMMYYLNKKALADFPEASLAKAH